MVETIIYNRTSTEDQNPENQLKDCQAINSYGEAQVIEDRQSAWKDNVVRMGFEDLKRRIRSRTIRHLIVWDLDRIYRNRKKLKEFFQFCKAYDCTIHSYRQTWLEEINKIPNPWNEIVYELLLNIFGWIAEEESSKKSARVKAAIKSKDGKTMSYKGNKWGRKTISKQRRDKIVELHKMGLKTREIALEANVGLGTVSRVINLFQKGMGNFINEKVIKNPVPEKDN